MRKPRVKKQAHFLTLDAGWFSKEDLSQEGQRWWEDTGWCAVFALLVNVYLNFPHQRIPRIASDKDLQRLREHWEKSVTFPANFAKDWPGLQETEVLVVLDHVYGLTCRKICENFTSLDKPTAKLDEDRDTKSLSKLACYQEFWQTNAVGFIVTDNCDRDGTEHHAIAFTTRGTKCSVVFLDTSGHSRITQDWFKERGDLIVLSIYQVYKPFR